MWDCACVASYVSGLFVYIGKLRPTSAVCARFATVEKRREWAV